MAWNLNLCMDWDKKILVPFHYYVQPHAQLPSTPERLTFAFSRLPFDLQLVVLEQCDTPTLFHLMQTCSRIRGPATKLFWANNSTDYWYHCPEYWLFSCDTRSPITRHCPEFAQHITKVEIDGFRLEDHFKEERESFDLSIRTSTKEKARDFWAKVNKVFPAVERVVLTGYEPRSYPPQAEEPDESYTTVESVVRCAPSRIIVRIAFHVLNLNRPRHYTLWKIPGRLERSWQVLNEDWAPTRVLLPPRKFPTSPLGDLLTFTRRNSDLLLETRGLDWLRIESYARYSINGAIHCPRLDCVASYEERDLWMQHLEESGHRRFESRMQSDEEPMLGLWCWKDTPDTEKAIIEARQQRIDAGYRQTGKLRRRVGYGWGPPGSEQRRLFEEEFATHLKELAFDEPEDSSENPHDSIEGYFSWLHEYFDRTHVYHVCSGPDEEHICYTYE